MEKLCTSTNDRSVCLTVAFFYAVFDCEMTPDERKDVNSDCNVEFLRTAKKLRAEFAALCRRMHTGRPTETASRHHARGIQAASCVGKRTSCCTDMMLHATTHCL